MNEPWSCPSPGCNYRGLESVHVLDIGSRPVVGHMTALDLIEVSREKREAERKELEKDTVLCEAELPVELFSGLTVSDIFGKALNLGRLLTYSERLIVKAADGNTVVSSPASLSPNCPTARLRIRWQKFVLKPTPEDFWSLARLGYEAIAAAESVTVDFPGGIEVVLKHRIRKHSALDMVPVRA